MLQDPDAHLAGEFMSCGFDNFTRDTLGPISATKVYDGFQGAQHRGGVGDEMYVTPSSLVIITRGRASSHQVYTW